MMHADLDPGARRSTTGQAGDFIKSGGSAIVGPDGEVLAGPTWNEEKILYADLDLNRIVEERRVFDVTGHYSRPDVLRLHFNASAQNAVEGCEQHHPPSGSRVPSTGRKESL